MGVGGVGVINSDFSIRDPLPSWRWSFIYIASPLYLDRCLDGNEDLGHILTIPLPQPFTPPPVHYPLVRNIYIDATHAANSSILTTSPFLNFSPASSSLAVSFLAVLFLLPDLYFHPFSSFLHFSVVVSSSPFFSSFFSSESGDESRSRPGYSSICYVLISFSSSS